MRLSELSHARGLSVSAFISGFTIEAQPTVSLVPVRREMPAELKSEKNTNTLKRALRANPNDPFAWYALGVSNYGKNQMDEALQCFTKADQVKEGFSAANYYYIGVLQQYMGRIDEAKQSFEKAAGLKAINVVDKKVRVTDASQPRFIYPADTAGKTSSSARALAQKMLVASEDFVGDVFE